MHFAFAFGVAEIGKWLNLTKVVYSVCMQHQPPAVHNDYLMGASWSSRLRNTTLNSKRLYVLANQKKNFKNKKYFAPQNKFHPAIVESYKIVAPRIRTCRIQNKYPNTKRLTIE